MTVKQVTRVAIMACIEFVIFGSFSDILYLECITLTILLFGLAFDKKEALLASIVFPIINMAMRQGVTPWSLMYLVIYPCYTVLIGLLRKPLLKHFWLSVLICGFLSFLTGQLVQLPFLLVSKRITLIYLIVGLKTSLIQGAVSALACLLLFKPCYRVLKQIERNEH